MNGQVEAEVDQLFYHDLVNRAHLHDVLELFVHVSQSELTLLELLEQLFIVVQVELLDFVNETLDIAHSEQLAYEWTRLEGLKVVRVFTGTNENDWTLSGRDSAERTTTLGVTVQFGDDDSSDIDLILEGFGLEENETS